MRRILLLSLAASSLVASPAMAQSRVPQRLPSMDQAGKLLSNPAVQDGLTDLIGQFADALLQTRVGPAAMLTDPRDDVRSNDTLGDVVRRDDPDFDRRLHDNTRRSLAVTGQALRGAADMQRELKATAARLQAVLGRIDARD